jgi:hypothetical protein
MRHRPFQNEMRCSKHTPCAVTEQSKFRQTADWPRYLVVRLQHAERACYILCNRRYAAP